MEDSAWVVVAGASVLCGLLAVVLVLRGLILANRRDLLARIDGLEGRLAAASDPDPGEDEERALLRGLPAEIGALRGSTTEALRRLAKRVEDVADRPAVAVAEAGVVEQVEPLLREVVEVLGRRLAALQKEIRTERIESDGETVGRALADQGYHDVAVLGEPEADGNRSRVLVEAVREGMTYKGPVWFRGGKVVEHQLTPSYPMFP